MPKFYLDTEEKGKGYIVGWMGRLQKTRDGQNNRKGGSATPPIEGDDFSFAASGAVVEPSILQVQKPSDRLGDFTVVRASDASYIDSNGVIQIAPDNVARIDYTNGVAELLTEPQSTNLITYSEDFTVWSVSGTSVVVSEINSIIDNSVAYKLENTSDAYGHIRINNTANPNTQYMFSFYLHSDHLNDVEVRIYSEDEGDIIGGQIVSNGLADGWNRIFVNFTTGAATDNVWCYIVRGNPLGSYCHATGAQLEALPYATSYIPTNGSTVTRLQDQITDGGNVNVINSEEGVLFFEGSALFNDTGENRYLSLSDGTENNVINISYNDTGALAQFLIYAGGALILTHAQPTVDITTNAKIAVKWKVNDFAIWINGAEVDTVLSGVVPTGLNSVNLSNAIGANYFNSRTRELKVYDIALTDEELEQITTL